MSWQLLIGLSVFLFSVDSLLFRSLMKSKEADGYAQAVVFTALVGFFSFIYLQFSGGPRSALSLGILPWFLLVSFLIAMGMVFDFKGLKLIGAAEYSILLSSSRFWVILGALLFLHENFTATRLLGAIILLFGVFLTEWQKNALVFSRGAIYELLAAFFFAAGEILSYFVIRNFDILSFMVYASFMVSGILIVLRPKILLKLKFYLKPNHALNVVTTSFNDGLANIFKLMAYQLGRNALQIGPLLATSTPLTVLLAVIFLKERSRMAQKIIGSLVVVAGTILLL
jgi:drug/metabolite transporter (DMT)-like permease